jgi:hypothetical protein
LEGNVRFDRPTADVAMVTSAHLSHSDDIKLRQRRYILTQSLRMACVVLATLLPVSLAWKGVFMVLAIALPWFGVVMANAGPTLQRHRKTSVVSRSAQEPVAVPVRIALEPGRVIDQV